MSASRMPWEIPVDSATHEWLLDGGLEVCAHCGVTRIKVAFFGGACIRKPADPWPDTEDAAAAHYAACNPEPGDPS